MDERTTAEIACARRYWRANLGIIAVLLAAWATAGLGGGVLLADWLNQHRLPGTGFRLGFWMAQQGSIIVFVLLVLVYAVLMNLLDRRHRAAIARIRGGTGASA